MNDFFQEFLRRSAQLRPNYPDSLHAGDPGFALKLAEFWHGALPDIISTIYSLVSGTRADIKDQSLMDFIPGYRLIHINETPAAYRALYRMSGNTLFFPFLANYSNDYIYVYEGGVYGFNHDDPSPYLMHVSGEKFLNTICEFYRQGVFFLDEDGYLDYDPKMEGIYGEKLNPGIPYWSD